MNSVKHTLLVLSCGGMEITWRYAWAFFLTLSILNRPFPLLESVAAFTMASLIAAVTGYRNWRVYQSLSLHIAGFIMTWLLLTHRFFYRPAPLFNTSWIADWFDQLVVAQHLFIQLLFFTCLLLFWLGARAMVKRQNNYFPVCLQFDKGIGAIFLLLLIKFIHQQKGGILLEDPVTRYLLFAFFTFSLIAISLSRNQSSAEKTFRPGYHGIGIVLGFVSMALIGSAAVIVMFLPHLTLMADSAQSILTEAARPMGSVVVDIIRFLFSIGRYRRDIGTQVTSNGSQVYPDADMGWARGPGWFMLAIFVLMALGLCAYLVHLLVCWLLKRNTMDKSQHGSLMLISKLLSMAAAICLSVWNGLLFLFKRIDSAAAVYAGLLRWGRRSGLPVVLGETPIEYGRRLYRHFPRLKKEIEMIIEAFNSEVYGNIVIDEKRLSRILAARRKMRSPRHWLPRLRAWFVQQPPQLQSSVASK